MTVPEVPGVPAIFVDFLKTSLSLLTSFSVPLPDFSSMFLSNSLSFSPGTPGMGNSRLLYLVFVSRLSSRLGYSNRERTAYLSQIFPLCFSLTLSHSHREHREIGNSRLLYLVFGSRFSSRPGYSNRERTANLGLGPCLFWPCTICGRALLKARLVSLPIEH